MTITNCPFISLEDLSDLFNEHDRWNDPLNLADDLRASGVSMYFRGVEADLKEHYDRIPKRNANGGIVIVAYKVPAAPSLAEVMVQTKDLPASFMEVLRRMESPSIRKAGSPALASPAKKMGRPPSSKHDDIRQYKAKNPNATYFEIATAVGTSESMVRRVLK